MSTIQELFKKMNIPLYQNESLDLDHYYQEPYQDNEESNESYQMSDPFETDKTKKKRRLFYEPTGQSLFAFFMDGSRRTYKIGDIVPEKGKIFPVVVAQVRAGCTKRKTDKKVHKHKLEAKNLLLLSSRLNDADFSDLKFRIERTETAKAINLELVQYKYDPQKDLVPTNAAIAKANSIMHEMEINILTQMVKSKSLDTDRMLIVDGPLQFIKEDKGQSYFADLFYNAVGVSKSFDPMLPISEKARGGQQIGTQLIDLNFAERTPVFYKKNSKGRIFGCWYLRIRPKNHITTPLEGIIKVEKMARNEDLENGFESDVIDNLSCSLIEEGIPTCHGRDERWAAHLYPVYLTETMIKSSFMGDMTFIHQFKKNF